ncbi:unnamed protein product, partial [Ectocarpus sp. 8 AP-2014]
AFLGLPSAAAAEASGVPAPSAFVFLAILILSCPGLGFFCSCSGRFFCFFGPLPATILVSLPLPTAGLCFRFGACCCCCVCGGLVGGDTGAAAAAAAATGEEDPGETRSCFPSETFSRTPRGTMAAAAV